MNVKPMSLKDLFKPKKKQQKPYKYAFMTNGYTPIYSQYGENAYQYMAVQQALTCIVSEIKKLNPQHIRMNGSDPVPQTGSAVQRVLENPNDRMTTSDFLEKVTWSLLLNYNAFILPVYDGNTLAALYPIQPTTVEFLENDDGELYVKFTFRNGLETTAPYQDVIHIRQQYSVSEYMGGDENGQPDHRALVKTLKLNESLLDGVQKALYGSFAINGVVKCKTHLDGDRVRAELQEFEDRLQTSSSGFAVIDNSCDFEPITHETAVLSTETLEMVDSLILRNFGVPLCILKGDYTTEQYNAFYQRTLEPIIITMSQALTKGVFSARERGFGNCIKLYPKDLVFLNTDQTLEMVRLLGDSGSLYENEKREAFGLRPLPELEGVRVMSLNYTDANEFNRQAGSSEVNNEKTT